MRINRLLARTKAQTLLTRHNLVNPPVDVFKLAKAENILVVKVKGEESISGFIQMEKEGTTVIGINSAHSPTRQRFTLAHELGHYFLHPSAETRVDIGHGVRFRDESSGEGVDPAEVEANLFAAELLMPTEFLLRDLSKIGSLDFSNQVDFEKVVDSLSSKYRVSKQAMTYRLGSLGIIISD